MKMLFIVMEKQEAQQDKEAV
jgi:hypothetical protein